jgi:trehalose/maltose hydrolase-like predicted phosphorylase
MQNVHHAHKRYAVTPLNYRATIRIMSGIDGAVRSNMTGNRQIAVVSASAVSRDKRTLLLEARTVHSGIGVKMAVRNGLSGAGAAPTLAAADSIFTLFECRGTPGRAIVLDKDIVVASSADAHAACWRDPLKALAKAKPLVAQEANARWWGETWERLDVRISGDDAAQLALRFCLFHLMCAAPRHADAMSMPCKLLTGEHYQGTTFYDTDLYIEPVFLFTFPDIARRMLAYRHVGLAPGRILADELGCRGAKFAWQSGAGGIEALGKWYRFTHTNIHINGDVAYSLMQYHNATGDADFMRTYGAEILVETARFYASRARRNDDASYSFADVAGPDEGHCESTDNYYTNLMARKNLLAACEIVGWLEATHPKDARRLAKKLDLQAKEIQEWRRVAERIRFLYDPATKIYEQCDGFFALEPAPADLLAGRTAWFVTVFPYQALNQPDVVMAHMLFRDEIDDDVKRANWDYYKGKSMNFSSMSFAVNAIMAKQMGEMDEAYRDFVISAGMDLDPSLTGRGDTGQGLHGTAMGGAWMAAVFGFGGVTLAKDRLLVEPRLPERWKSLAFTLRIRGEAVHFSMTHETIRVAVGDERSLELPARIAGEDVTLRSSETYEFSTRG